MLPSLVNSDQEALPALRPSARARLPAAKIEPGHHIRIQTEQTKGNSR